MQFNLGIICGPGSFAVRGSFADPYSTALSIFLLVYPITNLELCEVSQGLVNRVAIGRARFLLHTLLLLSSPDLCFQDTMLKMPFVAVDEEAATKNLCHGDDCGRIEGSQKLLHKHFSVKYRFHLVSFHFEKYRSPLGSTCSSHRAKHPGIL